MKLIAIKYDDTNPEHKARRLESKSLAAQTKAELIVLVKYLAAQLGQELKE